MPEHDAPWTPGPWRHEIGRNDVSFLGFPDGSGIPLGISKADADLIAAAPSLYEALSGVIETLDHWRQAYPAAFGEHAGAIVSPQTAQSYRRAKAALALARGEK